MNTMKDTIRDKQPSWHQRLVRLFLCFIGRHEYEIVAEDGYQQYAKCPHCGRYFMRDAHYLSDDHWQCIGLNPVLPNVPDEPRGGL